MKLGIFAISNKFSTKFKSLFLSILPISICVPVYSGNYLRSSNFFHALYMVYNPTSKKYENCDTKRVRCKRPNFEIRKLCTLDKFVK